MKQRLHHLMEMVNINTNDEKLLKYVRENNVKEIDKFLTSNEDIRGILSKIYDFYSCSILEIACMNDKTNEETVKKLLTFGANPNKFYPKHEHRSAIHFAAIRKHVKIIRELLNVENVEIDINATSEGKTALHFLTNVKNENQNLVECVKAVLNSDIQIHWRDHKGHTALYYACKHNHRNILKQILQKDNKISVEDKNELERLPGLPIDDTKYEVMTPNLGGYEYLVENKQNDFITWHEKLIMQDEENYNYDKNYEMSCLQLACKKNLPKAVEYLIKTNKANKVGARNKTNPLIIAARGGHDNIVKLFRDYNQVVVTDILFELLKRYNFPDSGKYRRCVEIVLSHTEINVNQSDPDNGLTPLHYAVQYAGTDIIKKILEKGASLANLDKFGWLAVRGVDQNTLKTHFDSCIKVEIPDDDLITEIIFDYRSLFPIRPNSVNENIDKEIDVLLHISEDTEQQKLLLHPLIASFLHVKWCRMLPFFISMICLYSILFISALFSKNFGFFYQILVSILLCFETGNFYLAFKWSINFDIFFTLIKIIGLIMLLFVDNPLYNSLAILLMAFKLVFFLEHVPLFSKYVVMIRLVSIDVMQLAVLVTIILVAFASVFKAMNPNLNIFESLFNTSLVLAGNIDTSNLNTDEYPTISRMIYLSYALLCCAVMFHNLLIGLAVNNTNPKQAELAVLINRVRYVSDMEKLALSCVLAWNWIRRWFKSKVFIHNTHLKVSLNKHNIISTNMYPNAISKQNISKLETYFGNDLKKIIEEARRMQKFQNNGKHHFISQYET